MKYEITNDKQRFSFYKAIIKLLMSWRILIELHIFPNRMWWSTTRNYFL